MILLAWDAYCEEREETERMIFGAQGTRIEPAPHRHPEWYEEERLTMGERFLLAAREHNRNWRLSGRDKPRPGARPRSASKVPAKR